MKIKYKLIIMIIGILSLAILPLSYLGMIKSREIIIESAYILSKNLSETISNVAREELFINSTFEGSERAVFGLNKEDIKGLKKIHVVNVNGVIVVDSEKKSEGVKISNSEIEYIKSIKTLLHRDLKEDNNILRFTYPIFLDKDKKEYKIGAAIFDFNKKELFQKVNDVRNNIIQFSILVVIVSLAFTYFTAGKFIKPIEELKKGAIIIGKGNLDYRIKINSKDEIGQLGKNFNKMAIALQKADKIKNDFLANTTHELKTPLNGIIGLAESMIENTSDKLSKENSVNVNFIISSGRRLTNLINDILDFSKLKSHDITLKLNTLDIKQVVEIVIFAYISQMKNKNVKLINDIPDNLPPVEADENRLQQILYNIIGNGIKFTEEGHVRISANLINGKILISVEDTGIGIPEDKLDTIFQSFEQVDASISRQYGGTGLGLSITKKLVELHGSKITVDSKVGKGSVFHFFLNLSKEEIVDQNEESLTKISFTENIEEESPPTKEKFKLETEGMGSVLVVDDEQVNLHVLRNQLKTQNYDTTIAINGMEAIDLLNKGIKPDIVLLDIMMPKMNGYEVCKVIREKYSIAELPILLITAKNQISDLLEGMESGANDYITKPFTLKELLARVKTHLNVSRMNHSYAKFVPKEILQFLNRESIVDLQLGDQSQRDMTILFSDIRSFTSISEKMSPKDNFNFINSYLRHIGPIIRFNKGFIDKYIGDAIMALFPDNTENGVKAAIQMQSELISYNIYRKSKGFLPIEIGIGLNSGTLMLGIIGEQERMEGTVISDAVNLASRLENLTKEYGSKILISENVYKNIPHPEIYNHRFLEYVKVKGKKESVGIIEILDGLPENTLELRLKTKPIFEEGQMFFEIGKYTDAKEKFKEVLKLDREDKAAESFLN
ncbi:MAG: response regulator, partial [Leptospiraceae bacterium]|nr:response regulator [Leptospiraceae bacterium]